MTGITEAIAIELTRRIVKADEQPIDWNSDNGGAVVMLSDLRILYFNRVEVEHARLMLKKGEMK